jgi:tetratricopeptide (TPR) repeat protein
MALIKCPECKNEISDNALICPYCGIAIRGKFIKCPECSRLVSINAKACPECGFPIQKELIRKSQNAEKANTSYANAQTFLKNQQEKEALSYIEEALQIYPNESTFIALKQHIEEIIEKKIQSAEIFKDAQIAFEKEDLELSLTLVEKALQQYEDKEYVAFKEKVLTKKADILKAEENYQIAKQAFEKDNLLKAYQTIKISCLLFADNTLYLEFQKEIENRLCEQLYSQAKNSLDQKKYMDADDKITECLTYRPKVDVYIDLKQRIQSKMKRNKVLKRVFIGIMVTVLLVIGISTIGPRLIETYNDNNAWNTAQNENTIVSYSSYITHYPKGIHIEQANGARASLILESENISISNPSQPIEQKVENSNLTIGQRYQGGIIFWLDATGQHGLIAATTDQSTGIQWYNGTDTITNAVGDGIGAGMSNTKKIIANQGAGSYAAQLCANYHGGGYGDWYLPSQYELNLLYQQKTAVGGFARAGYWSSTESSNGSAWWQDFVYGYQYNDDKYYPYSVRAIRAF